MVVTEEEVSLVAVRSALYDLQRKGQFKHLKVRKVKDSDGYKMYVINTMEKTGNQKRFEKAGFG